MADKKLNKKLYSTAEGARFFASAKLSNATLLLIACALWTFITQNLLHITATNALKSLALYVSPVCTVIAYIMVFNALKKEQQADAFDKDAKPDKFLSVLSTLVIAFLAVAFLVFMFYTVLSFRLKAVIAASGNDAVAYFNATKLLTRVQVLANGIDKVFSVTNVAAVFIGRIYVREQNDVRLHNFSFAAVLVTLISFLLILVNYALQFIGKSNGAYSACANLTIYAVYFVQYLTFEARKEKYRRLAEPDEAPASANTEV